MVPPLAKFAAVMAPPPELLEVLELDELLEDELELLEDELELLEDELELRPLELELLELELELLELELELPVVSPPQPSRLSTGIATAVVLMMRTILRREAVVLRVDSSVFVVIVCTIEANYCGNDTAGATNNTGFTAAESAAGDAQRRRLIQQLLRSQARYHIPVR